VVGGTRRLGGYLTSAEGRVMRLITFACPPSALKTAPLNLSLSLFCKPSGRAFSVRAYSDDHHTPDNYDTNRPRAYRREEARLQPVVALSLPGVSTMMGHSPLNLRTDRNHVGPYPVRATLRPDCVLRQPLDPCRCWRPDYTSNPRAQSKERPPRSIVDADR
jgi:hypothetical protein